MKKAIIILALAIFAFSIGYYGGDYLERFKNIDWGIVFQVFIFLILPGLGSIMAFIWFVRFLSKISRKLDK